MYIHIHGQECSLEAFRQSCINVGLLETGPCWVQHFISMVGAKILVDKRGFKYTTIIGLVSLLYQLLNIPAGPNIGYFSKICITLVQDHYYLRSILTSLVGSSLPILIPLLIPGAGLYCTQYNPCSAQNNLQKVQPRKKNGLLICVEIVGNQTPSSQYYKIHGNTRCILCIRNPQQFEIIKKLNLKTAKPCFQN